MAERKENELADINAKLENFYEKKDFHSMAVLLENLIVEDISKSEYIKYRKYYRSLPIEIVEGSHKLCVILSIIEVISGNTKASDNYVRLLQTKQYNLRRSDPLYKEIEYYLVFLEAALPHRSKNKVFSSLKVLAKSGTKQKEVYWKLAFASNRPSIINGGKDFSRYVKYIPRLKKTFKKFAKKYFGGKSIGVVEAAVAEILYQQNKLYEALVQIVSIIPFIEREGYTSTLFAAMRLQMRIMVISGQSPSAKPMADIIRKRLLDVGAEYLLPNLNAMIAVAAMYDGNYEYINQWMKEDAPNELEGFCTLDRYQYFVKLRVYLIYGYHLSFVALSECIEPILDEYGKYMDKCELYALKAMSYDSAGKKEEAFVYLEKALKIAERYEYNRLLADEGKRLYNLLREYSESHTETSYLSKIIDMTRKTALLYPNYLKERKEYLPSLTDAEMEVLRLIAAEYTNAEIGDFLGITVNTVKFHIKNIFSKLNVINRRQAVRISEESGIL